MSSRRVLCWVEQELCVLVVFFFFFEALVEVFKRKNSLFGKGWSSWVRFRRGLGEVGARCLLSTSTKMVTAWNNLILSKVSISAFLVGSCLLADLSFVPMWEASLRVVVSAGAVGNKGSWVCRQTASVSLKPFQAGKRKQILAVASVASATSACLNFILQHLILCSSYPFVVSAVIRCWIVGIVSSGVTWILKSNMSSYSKATRGKWLLL